MLVPSIFPSVGNIHRAFDPLQKTLNLWFYGMI